MPGSDSPRARILDQLRRVFSGPSWVGPSTEDVLALPGPEQACAPPAVGANRIIELVLHLAWWKEAARRALDGEPLPPAGDDFPAPSSPSAAEAWPEAVRSLREAHRKLLARIETMADADLDRTVPGRDYAFEVLLLGLAQHEAYHLGQIRLLAARA
ncbi:MAG: DinB family protein [Gemmatimonadetes bacterium]|nr:DinB family protein [Gemmatimonadota bacterium]